MGSRPQGDRPRPAHFERPRPLELVPVRGQLLQEGWGAELGYPGIVLDLDGPTVGVQLFESSDLPHHWARLDEFEGAGYRRAVTAVTTTEGDLLASIYVLAPH